MDNKKGHPVNKLNENNVESRAQGSASVNGQGQQLPQIQRRVAIPTSRSRIVQTLPVIASVADERRSSLARRENEIRNLCNDQLKTVLLNMVGDMKNIVEDHERMVQFQNKILTKKIYIRRAGQNGESSTNPISRIVPTSSNNIQVAVAGRSSGNHERVVQPQSHPYADRVYYVNGEKNGLDVIRIIPDNSNYIPPRIPGRSYPAYILFLDDIEAANVNSATLNPRRKFIEILISMNIIPPKESVEVGVMTLERNQNGSKRLFRILLVTFTNLATFVSVCTKASYYNRMLDRIGRGEDKKYIVQPVFQKTNSQKKI